MLEPWIHLFMLQRGFNLDILMVLDFYTVFKDGFEQDTIYFWGIKCQKMFYVNRKRDFFEFKINI